MGELKAPIGPNTAHLCIDMQRLFSDEGPWPMAWMPRVTPKVEQLVARAPERTIFTRFILRRSRRTRLGGGALITKSNPM
jgi:nicotinamidase-related amidase